MSRPGLPESVMDTRIRGVGILESGGVLTREGGVSCRTDIHPSSAATSWTRWLLAGRSQCVGTLSTPVVARSAVEGPQKETRP